MSDAPRRAPIPSSAAGSGVAQASAATAAAATAKPAAQTGTTTGATRRNSTPEVTAPPYQPGCRAAVHRPVPRRRRAPPRARRQARSDDACGAACRFPPCPTPVARFSRARPIGPSPGRGIPWSRHAESPERGGGQPASRSAAPWIGLNPSDVEVRIEPEPTDAERRAIVAAIEDAAGSHPAYASAWRRAGLPGSDGDASPAQAATPRRAAREPEAPR